MKSGMMPYGKTGDPRTDAREQAILEFVRARREERMTWIEIAELLNDEDKYRPRIAKTWSRMNLSKVARYSGIR